MTCSLNAISIPVVNLIFCLIILSLGIVGAKKNKAILLIGLAFGLFAIVHVISILGLQITLQSIKTSIRLLAYLVIILGMLKLAK